MAFFDLQSGDNVWNDNPEYYIKGHLPPVHPHNNDPDDMRYCSRDPPVSSFSRVKSSASINMLIM